MKTEPQDAELSKLIEDFEYQKDRLPAWVVELVYRLRNSEADIALKLGRRIHELESRPIERAYDALCLWLCTIANSGSIDWADIHHYHSLVHPKETRGKS